ncbi:MalY/PatB family protein [Methylophaga sp.]|uniref:MalY/PatB family protein n=1 Tax=Methylophaga sp. TaxID=2024840 RepID=UPI00140131CA|nr:pyridoxal phosphate-dependent aminotransferase [Methylophaga sp.]MTI63280.1 pyridoxal phosphate-dependent aminotransferase [Methylophaga sp.]
MMFDFDAPLDRSGSNSLKFDARQAYFGRADVMPMWVADMDFAAPPAVTEALVSRAQHPIYGYTLYPDSLYQSLIDWCQRRYQWSIKRSHILMCPGVVPSLHAAIEALTEPGDKVIAQPPVYFPFFTAVTQTGRELVTNPLKLEHGHYTMDLEHLEQCARQGARLLLLCSPHNPVGRVWQRQELMDLLAVAARYEMTIISDEIHADLIFPGQTHLPLADLSDSVNVLTAIAPSKTFNIPGLGLSSLVVPQKADRKAINQVFDSWHVSAANPFSITAYEAAYRHGDAWLDALMAYLQQSLDSARRFIDAELDLIDLIVPEGTYLLWLDCRQMNLDNQALRAFFIDKAGVGMNPGNVFGDVGSGFMRLNMGCPRAQLDIALGKMADALNDFTR